MLQVVDLPWVDENGQVYEPDHSPMSDDELVALQKQLDAEWEAYINS